MAKGVKGTGPRSKYKPTGGEVAAEVRALTGWGKTKDKIGQLRMERARAMRGNAKLTPEQVEDFAAREERMRAVRKEASKRALAALRKTQELQGFAKAALCQTAMDALPDAFGVVFSVLLDESAPHAVRLEAARMVRDWAFPRHQDVGGLVLDGAADVRDVSELSASELSAMAEELSRLLATKRAAAAIESEPVAEGVPEPAGEDLE